LASAHPSAIACRLGLCNFVASSLLLPPMHCMVLHPLHPCRATTPLLALAACLPRRFCTSRSRWSARAPEAIGTLEARPPRCLLPHLHGNLSAPAAGASPMPGCCKAPLFGSLTSGVAVPCKHAQARMIKTQQRSDLLPSALNARVPLILLLLHQAGQPFMLRPMSAPQASSALSLAPAPALAQPHATPTQHNKADVPSHPVFFTTCPRRPARAPCLRFCKRSFH